MNGLGLTNGMTEDEAQKIDELVRERENARQQKDYFTADSIRKYLFEKNIVVKDAKDGKSSWQYATQNDEASVLEVSMIVTETQTLSARKSKNTRKRQRTVLKRARFNLFVDWLKDTYGIDFLRASGGVLDVAGGKGRLAVCLGIDNDISCTVIDPNIERLSEFTTFRIAKMANDYFIKDTIPRKHSLDHTIIPNQSLKQSNQNELIEPAIVTKIGQSQVDKILEFLQVRGVNFFKVLFNDEFFNNEVGKMFMKNASIFVGMHPDEATESIVDYALLLDKPFAVVPCCVFPCFFPNRRLCSGEFVRSLDQFIQYLLEKDPRIMVDVMVDMVGCNKIVYKLPTS